MPNSWLVVGANVIAVPLQGGVGEEVSMLSRVIISVELSMLSRVSISVAEDVNSSASVAGTDHGGVDGGVDVISSFSVVNNLVS